MMSYATIDNVKSMFRDFWNGSDAAVTDVELQEFLDAEHILINSKLSTIYAGLPATVGANPNAFEVLKMVEKYKVAGIVDDILNAGDEHKANWGEKGEALLNQLVPRFDSKTCKQCPPDLILDDLSYLGTTQQKNQIKISATSGRVFEKGGENW